MPDLDLDAPPDTRQVITVSFDCCGHTAHYPAAIGPAQTLLHQPALGGTLLAMADAEHAAYANCPHAGGPR